MQLLAEPLHVTSRMQYSRRLLAPWQVANLGAAVERLNREKVKLEQQMVRPLLASAHCPHGCQQALHGRMLAPMEQHRLKVMWRIYACCLSAGGFGAQLLKRCGKRVVSQWP